MEAQAEANKLLDAGDQLAELVIERAEEEASTALGRAARKWNKLRGR